MNDCSSGRLVSFLVEGDDVVSCEVCLEQFQPVERPPKILPCGHNFCDQCLFSLCCHQQYYLLDSIRCPTCRASFPTDVAKVAPTNWDLCSAFISATTKIPDDVLWFQRSSRTFNEDVR
ncbi:hypothetical protein ANCDUO_01503 [Ancylostoma duodenale]|uniref:RING-type domain-containing protein n=1 Tax=Ancylostoma duodenale TaxID=51022 RepID=A0A0C2H946_9BILA|nr:hypothetical protein ANCDUO_01503 [Ancylostoma duodenale]